MLSVRNLVKVYKTKGGAPVRALDGVSVDFPEKGMVFLLGRSGSGKSTLLNMAGGLDEPDSGEIIIKASRAKIFPRPTSTVTATRLSGLSSKSIIFCPSSRSARTSRLQWNYRARRRTTNR